jgi:hypothetical protein
MAGAMIANWAVPMVGLCAGERYATSLLCQRLGLEETHASGIKKLYGLVRVRCRVHALSLLVYARIRRAIYVRIQAGWWQ